MKIHVVIGKNFGDEGKGLTVDYFSLLAKKKNKKCLVIRHNGGAQAGHTVDFPDKRFIFHQLSSGSFRGADTLWSETYLPDLYKLGEEISDFCTLSGKTPTIFADIKCRCVYIDDILINMALETARGDNRHGSCGMGINEAVVRSATNEFLLSLGTIKGMNAHDLFCTLKRIRKNYVPLRLKELGLDIKSCGQYGELLTDNNVLENTAEQMCRNTENIKLFSPDFLNHYEEIIFEGAQGLLLDEFYLLYEPHLTSSRTGAYNPDHFCHKYMPAETVELVYVTRTYVTRHGCGPLPYADLFDHSKYHITDKTNITNDWQGSLRFAVHGTQDEFFSAVKNDISGLQSKFTLSLMLTHLDETNGKLLTCNREIPIGTFTENICKEGLFDKLYLSQSKYANEILYKIL